MNLSNEQKKDIGLALAFALLGIVFTLKPFIIWLNGLNTLQGFGIYYLIIFVTLFILSKFKLVILGTSVKGIKQIIGLTLIMFSFFVIFNWESPYINLVTNGTTEGVSGVYFQSEDGVTWWAWEQVGVTDMNIHWFLTFVFTPFILTLLGGFLLIGRPSMSII